MSKLKFKSKILYRAHILNQYAKYTTKMSAGLFFLFFKDIFIRYKVDRSFSFSTSKMLLHCFLAPLFVKIMRVHTVVPCMWCVISFWLLSSLSLQFGFHQFGYDVPRHNPPFKRQSYSRFLYFSRTLSLTPASSSSDLLKIWRVSLSLDVQQWCLPHPLPPHIAYIYVFPQNYPQGGREKTLSKA